MWAGSVGDPIGRRGWCLILGLAWGLHNSEEWLLAPQVLQFMQSDAPAFLRDVYAGIAVSELRGILLILSAVLLGVIAIAGAFSTAAASAFGMTVVAALLGLNAVFHVALFTQTGVYLAGLVTAVLVSLPVAATLLVRARQQSWVSARVFWIVLPVAVLIHGPVLDAGFRLSLSVVRA